MKNQGGVRAEMKEGQANKPREIEIDLRGIIRLLWNKANIILLCGILVAILAFGVTKLFVVPQYESVTKMYVLTKQNNEVLTQGDMQASTYITKDYAELIKSRTVTETVIAKLELDMKSKELLKKVDVFTPMDTRIVGISVRDEDPYKAAEIADAMRDISGQHIRDVMEVETVNTVEGAEIPEESIGPNATKNALLFGVTGSFLMLFIVILMHMLKDTIKIEEDIKKYLELSTLGIIPLNEGEKKSKREKKPSEKEDRIKEVFLR